MRELQAVVGREAREQCVEQLGALPDAVIACVGGGSNAIGIFAGFLKDEAVKLYGIEAAGEGLTGKHAAPLTAGEVGVLHGAKSYLLQTADGQIDEAHSISAGLDYPGVGPEHSYLRDTGRATYLAATDAEALAAFEALARLEGILPALESAHAIAACWPLAKELGSDAKLLVCLSGRGDKDLDTVLSALEAKKGAH